MDDKMADKLKTLKEVRCASKDPLASLFSEELQDAAREWVDEINKIISYQWTEEEKKMVPFSVGRMAKGHIKETKLRQNFFDETGILIDDEYDMVDGIEFIKHFFNLED